MVPRGDGGSAGALWQSCARREEGMSGFRARGVSGALLRAPHGRAAL